MFNKERYNLFIGVSQNVDDHRPAAPVYNNAYQSLFAQQELTAHDNVVITSSPSTPSSKVQFLPLSKDEELTDYLPFP
jgi:hypothetical protein